MIVRMSRDRRTGLVLRRSRYRVASNDRVTLPLLSGIMYDKKS